jgi:hypothetical protein
MRAAFILAGVMLVTAAATAQPAQPGQNGRYVILFSPHVRADTFLLDTQTGRVWVQSQYSDLNQSPTAWSPMERLDTPQQLDAFVKEYGLAPKNPPPAGSLLAPAPTTP